MNNFSVISVQVFKQPLLMCWYRKHAGQRVKIELGISLWLVELLQATDSPLTQRAQGNPLAAAGCDGQERKCKFPFCPPLTPDNREISVSHHNRRMNMGSGGITPE
jgi:hypothetical protein